MLRWTPLGGCLAKQPGRQNGGLVYRGPPLPEGALQHLYPTPLGRDKGVEQRRTSKQNEIGMSMKLGSLQSDIRLTTLQIQVYHGHDRPQHIIALRRRGGIAIRMSRWVGIRGRIDGKMTHENIKTKDVNLWSPI